MKICIAALSCLVIGLLAPLAHAMEKPQRAESRVTDRKKGGPVARQPADRASKMLSDFDTDGDSILNMWELTAMFEGMRDRLHRAKNERGRAGQGRMAQSRTVADRRGKRRDLGAGSGRNQPSKGRPNEPKYAGAFSDKLKNAKERPAVNSPKWHSRVQSGDPAHEQRPGGGRPEPNTAQ
ncbi:MAG: hypothetical protein CBD74_00255 [Saprospirales bacterium TMED214]|nr:MAG: hypothetical protein CBD74_00255 [Saprospirales bacterium TMED214]